MKNEVFTLPIMLGCLFFIPLGVAASVEDDLGTMQRMEKEMKRQSVALLSVIKQMGPVEGEDVEAVAVEKVRLITEGCSIFESNDEASRVLLAPRINEEFKILDQVDNFYRIFLDDGREGWILESCVQPFTEDVETVPVRFTGVNPKQLKKYMDVAAEIFAMIEERKAAADELYLGYSSAPEGDIHQSYSRIKKYYDYAVYFYNKFVAGYEFPESAKKDIELRLSAWGELLFGKSTYETKIIDEDDDKTETTTSNIAFGGDLAINERSNVSVGFSRKQEAIQTVFKSTAFDAGYGYKTDGGLGLNARAGYFKYQDELTGANDYKRLSAAGRADLIKSSGGDLWVDYTFMNNNYDESDSDDYVSNRVNAQARVRKSKSKSYLFGVRSNFETSDATFHKFTHVTPSISYLNSDSDKSFKFTGSYELLKYSDAGPRSFGRATLDLSSSTHRAGKRGTKNLAVTFKDFPDNNLSTYVQVRGKYSTSSIGAVTRRFAASFYTYIFTNKSNNSYTDVKTDFGGGNKSAFASFSTYSRLWHSAGEKTDSTAGKPYVADIYANAGFIVKNVRFGPTFGVHTLISKGEKILKRDGNLFRFGGMVEGTVLFPHNIRLRVNSSYDYGHVYNNKITVNSSTGNITLGELVKRHPTTFQLGAYLLIPVIERLDFSANFNTYTVKTDIDKEISINPIAENGRFSAFAGLKYRFN